MVDTDNKVLINKKVLNKYSNIKEIFDKEYLNNKNKYIIKKEIQELKNLDINNIKIEFLKKLACKIFDDNHCTNEFFNNNTKIVISHSGINESIQKIYYSKFQKIFLLEHLKVISCLGKILENSKLVNQVYEKKEREKYLIWNYYICNIFIESKNYLIVFEVVTMRNSINSYRIQRLNLLEK